MAQKKATGLELKVGITAGVALIFLAVIIFTVEKVHFGKAGYPVYVSFQFVDAIQPQADVVIGGGVKIGHVAEIEVLGERISLKVMLDNNVKIPKDARFSILSKGMMGDKYLNVAAESDSQDFLEPNARIEGVEPSNMDKAFRRLGQLADSIQVLLGDPELKTSFSGMMRNFSSMSRRLDRMVKVNEKNINSSVTDFAAAAKSVKRFSRDLATVTSELEKLLQPQNRENIEATLANLQTLSARLDKQVASLEKGHGPLGVLLNDEQMARDLKHLVKDLKDNPWKILWK